MTVLEIITYPDSRLSEMSEPVKVIDEEVKRLVEDMADTMFEAPGLGLAAVQVGILKKILVYSDQPEAENKSYKVLINPEIVKSDGKHLSENEGCLSVPEFRSNVQRAAKVSVKALNLQNEPVEINAEGMLAVVLQHEIDHLNGILFIDRISSLKRQIYKRKVNKLIKEA
ncbi:MAG: peptide deformylase [Proteobacteria bacterium]|nr:peptide deformylase [Pseudomonadota bacterium]